MFAKSAPAVICSLPKKLIPTLAFLTMLSTGTAHAVPVVNGSFETGLTGWTASGTVESKDIEGATNGTFSAVFGYGNFPNNGVISQVLATVAGKGYTLNFDYGAFGQSGVLQSLRVEVLGGLTLLDTTVGAVAAGFSTTTFASNGFSFVADSGSTTLRFSDLSGAVTNNVDGILDNVTVAEVSGPGALSVFGFGALCLGYTRRRKSA